MEWDLEWSRLPDDIRRALDALSSHGIRSVGDLRGRRPDVPSCLLDVYEAFYLLDRDGMSGRVQLSSMREMLALLEIGERAEQMATIRIWRQMDARRSEADERMREAKRRTDGEAGPRSPV